MSRLPPGEDAPGASVLSLEDVRRQRHSRDQLDSLFREHGEFLRRLAGRLCRGSFDPDDLVQDVLERTVQNFDRLPPGVDHRAWMTRVMRNLFIDQLRRRTAAPGAVPLDAEPVAPPAEHREWWEGLAADDIRAKLHAVPEELRAAFELFALEGCSYQAIAERLGVPKATVGTRILRARRKLKQLFSRTGPDGSEGDDD
jgi:RNA polymerase sigma-70 factor (ECF subfamily)